MGSETSLGSLALISGESDWLVSASAEALFETFLG